MLDDAVRWLSIGASVATLVGIVFLVRQIRIGIEQSNLAREAARIGIDQLRVGIDQLQVAQSTLEEDQRERKRNAATLRRSLWRTLTLEVVAITNAARSNLARFRPSNLGNPDENEALRDKDIKGEPAYNRAFVWTPVPVATLEHIMTQTYLMDLGPDEMNALNSLRLAILRLNALASAKNALLPNLVEGPVPSRQPSLQWHRWAEMEADQLNMNLESNCHQISNACQEIMKWLSASDNATVSGQ